MTEFGYPRTICCSRCGREICVYQTGPDAESAYYEHPEDQWCQNSKKRFQVPLLSLEVIDIEEYK